MNAKRRVLAGLAAVALAITVGIVGAAPAEATPNKPIGQLACGGYREIHTISKARGNVTHGIYGALQWGAMWETTDQVWVGHSDALTSWNQHHWLYKSMKGGKVFGSDVTLANSQCE